MCYEILTIWSIIFEIGINIKLIKILAEEKNSNETAIETDLLLNVLMVVAFKLPYKNQN